MQFGAKPLFENVNVKFGEGYRYGLIGANGAGKSTLLNTISGFLKPKQGELAFKGKPLPKRPDRIVQAGICHVPEGRLVFANLSVEDNLKMGAFLRNDREGVSSDLERVYGLFPRLKERLKQSAGTLSGGEQQMLAMGRALMTDGELILMDEPSLGLAPILVQTVFDIIEEFRKLGKTILLVEQNAYKALEVADRAYVLEQGRIVKAGPAAEVKADPSVRAAYLGTESAVGG
ncbi:ABC transporter ATP-binding protein [uncultured Azonexus sp.]|uniref:ABC transporter ATP-binding protein n=1 Tax=uncultured Azonexus sp. TaxID=520307 RepID=UPI003459F8FE